MESALVSGLQGLFARRRESHTWPSHHARGRLRAALSRHRQRLRAAAYWCPSASAPSWSTSRLADMMGKEGFLRFFYDAGVLTEVFPLLIFIGIGAMTDFQPLLQNPKIILLGAAGQFGIFLTLLLALALGFDKLDAVAVAVIGACDGPTAIYVSSKFAPHMLGAVSVAAYSYMSLVPLIQPPIMRALTTDKERTNHHGRGQIRADFENRQNRLPDRGDDLRFDLGAQRRAADRHGHARQSVARKRLRRSSQKRLGERNHQHRHAAAWPMHRRHHGSRQVS